MFFKQSLLPPYLDVLVSNAMRLGYYDLAYFLTNTLFDPIPTWRIENSLVENTRSSGTMLRLLIIM